MQNCEVNRCLPASHGSNVANEEAGEGTHHSLPSRFDEAAEGGARSCGAALPAGYRSSDRGHGATGDGGAGRQQIKSKYFRVLSLSASCRQSEGEARHLERGFQVRPLQDNARQEFRHARTGVSSTCRPSSGSILESQQEGPGDERRCGEVWGGPQNDDRTKGGGNLEEDPCVEASRAVKGLPEVSRRKANLHGDAGSHRDAFSSIVAATCHGPTTKTGRYRLGDTPLNPLVEPRPFAKKQKTDSVKHTLNRNVLAFVPRNFTEYVNDISQRAGGTHIVNSPRAVIEARAAAETAEFCEDEFGHTAAAARVAKRKMSEPVLPRAARRSWPIRTGTNDVRRLPPPVEYNTRHGIGFRSDNNDRKVVGCITFVRAVAEESLPLLESVAAGADSTPVLEARAL